MPLNINNKMAEAVFTLSSPLCFLVCKFGKLNVKQLKDTLIEFYNVEELSSAKQRLLDDILKMNSSVMFPHVPQRRDGENRAKREVDDILQLFTVLDESKLLGCLPKYVTDNPDKLPSASLYGGDLFAVMMAQQKLENSVSNIGSSMVAIAHDVYSLRSIVTRQQLSTERVRELAADPGVRPNVNRPTGQAPFEQRSNHGMNEMMRGNSNPCCSTECREPAAATASSTDNVTIGATSSMSAGADWAAVAIMPPAGPNRYDILASTNDEPNQEDTRPFTEVQYKRSLRLKRMRERSSQNVTVSSPPNTTNS